MKAVLPLQVKGHLDYMRQMDTILVAVGVPTKEVPGAAIALPYSVTGRDVADQKGDAALNPAEEAEPRAQGGGAGVEEGGTGWDIPDISDLLDSADETEQEDRTSTQISSTLEGGVTDARRGRAEGAELEEEQLSWSWKDADWTTVNPHE